MNDADHAGQRRFRVWIAGYDDWRPGHPRGVPPAAVALEPAEPETMPADQAAAYVEAFNRVALAAARKIWAVAFPVTTHYRGDPRPGQKIADSQHPGPNGGSRTLGK